MAVYLGSNEVCLRGGTDNGNNSSSDSEMEMKTGETTSNVINTGLTSVSAFVLYVESITATGIVTTVWTAESGKTQTIYCSSYSSYLKSVSTSSSDTDISIDGGSVTWNGTGNKAMTDGATYNWIAFGEA